MAIKKVLPDYKGFEVPGYIVYPDPTKYKLGSDDVGARIYLKKDILDKNGDILYEKGWLECKEVSANFYDWEHIEEGDTPGPGPTPSVDVDRGLDQSTGKIGHTNSVTAQTTATLAKITYDAQGHITSATPVTLGDGLLVDGNTIKANIDDDTIKITDGKISAQYLTPEFMTQADYDALTEEEKLHKWVVIRG